MRKRMKIIVLTTLCIGLAATAHGLPSLRTVPADTTHRNLQAPDWPWAFLVSHTSANEQWCLEAKHGTATGANIGISPCDFDRAPDDQLWILANDGKIHSKLNENQCLIVGDGNGVSGGDRILFASCNANTEYNKFTHNRGTDQIKVKQNPNFCLTQTGNSPQLTDTIRTEPCSGDPSFTFTYRDHQCSTTLRDVECCSNNDCPFADNTCTSSYECIGGRNNCGDDNDCNSGLICIRGDCVIECTRNADCGSNQICSNSGECMWVGCTSNADCPSDYICSFRGDCVKVGCTSNADCPSDHICSFSGDCVKVGCTSHADCPVGHYCTSNGDCELF